MYASTIIASTALLASSIIAGPVPAPYMWSVSNFQGGASPATSYESFDISGPAYQSTDGGPAVPAFQTTCHWAAINGAEDYQACDAISDGRSVSAKLSYTPSPQGESGYNVDIQYEFPVGEALYIYEGNTTVVSDPSKPANFFITPSSVRAVA